MTQPVRWKQTMAYLREENVESAVELGPGRTLKNLLQQDYPSFSVLAFDSEKDHGTLLSSSREALPLGEGNLRIVEACLAAAVATRNRNEDLRAYELGVIKPYREIERLLLESEENGTVPTDDAIQGVLQRLMTIMQTKFVSEQEQRERLSAILPGSHSRKFPTPFNL
jgi:[acyl-carrier-protein] S-malonyltransferase